LIEPGDTESHGHEVWFSEEHMLLQHYLIVGHGSKGLELPHIFSDSGEEVLPVFSLEEAAREFLSLSSLGERWCVRGFSAGELVSLLFILHERVAWILPNPPPEDLLAEDALSHLTSRERFVEFLIAH
jgi:hypothetical protein